MKLAYRIVVAIAFAVLLASVVIAYIDWPADSGWENAGQTGDFWGGHFSAAGSIAAALLFFVAVLMQRDELEAQREQLRLTVVEMEQARKVHEAQEQQLARQAESAERSAVVAEVLSLMSFRNQLRMQQYQNLDNELVKDLRNQLRETEPFLIGLLNSNSLVDQERAYLARAAGLVEKIAQIQGVKIVKPPES